MEKIPYNNKISKKISEKNITLKKFTSVFFLKLYLLLFFTFISKEKETNGIKLKNSYIELKVKGPGNSRIFYMNKTNNLCKDLPPPNETEINENKTIQNPNMEYYLDYLIKLYNFALMIIQSSLYHMKIN